MTTPTYQHPDEIRRQFSSRLSAMYKLEVPLYGDLLEVVSDINADARDASWLESVDTGGIPDRLMVERHGAIRLGKPAELAMIGRMFAVMGMEPVGYYDLSLAGLPVHATAFRPIDEVALARNPFRVFTSLLRLELIEDADLRGLAADVLDRRQIFTERCVAFIEKAESAGGLTAEQADKFIDEALYTFRWHGETTVDEEVYERLKAAHPLVADVVCFKGPHINHLTPRVVDIDRAQLAMIDRGIPAKETVEGPPRRRCPILLRQTSFLALDEPIRFNGKASVDGSHTARFGEIEQRGCALTRKGRELYDAALAESLASRSVHGKGERRDEGDPFARFPDDWVQLRRDGLAFFQYRINMQAFEQGRPPTGASLDALIKGGWVVAQPLIYEDFLPVSAAGIFRSNLRAMDSVGYEVGGNQHGFEAALGRSAHNEFDLYAAAQAASIVQCEEWIRHNTIAPMHH